MHATYTGSLFYAKVYARSGFEKITTDRMSQIIENKSNSKIKKIIKKQELKESPQFEAQIPKTIEDINAINNENNRNNNQIEP